MNWPIEMTCDETRSLFDACQSNSKCIFPNVHCSQVSSVVGQEAAPFSSDRGGLGPALGPNLALGVGPKPWLAPDQLLRDFYDRHGQVATGRDLVEESWERAGIFNEDFGQTTKESVLCLWNWVILVTILCISTMVIIRCTYLTVNQSIKVYL